MKSSDMVRELCKREKVAMSELARRLGQTPQNFAKKMNRDTLTLDEMIQIADVLGVSYEQSFVLADGNRIAVGNDSAVQKCSV